MIEQPLHSTYVRTPSSKMRSATRASAPSRTGEVECAAETTGAFALVIERRFHRHIWAPEHMRVDHRRRYIGMPE